MSEFSNKMNSAVNKKFIKNMVETASPMQLIIILYDGAIQWLQMSKQEIQKNAGQPIPDWTDFSLYMGKAIAILTHLQESLDRNQSREFAEGLFDLYNFMKTTLFKANMKKSETDISEIVQLLRDLKSGWQEAIKNVSAGTSTTPQTVA